MRLLLVLHAKGLMSLESKMANVVALKQVAPQVRNAKMETARTYKFLQCSRQLLENAELCLVNLIGNVYMENVFHQLDSVSLPMTVKTGKSA